MNKKIIALLVLVSFSLLSAPVMAHETSTPHPHATSTRATSTKPRENVQNKIQEKREEVRAKLSAARIRNIRNYFKTMGRRIEAAIERLEKLAERIESRIEKMEERGVDVAKAKTELAEAEVKITEAKTAFADAKAKLEAALSSETPKESFKQVREGLVKGVVEKIKAAHQALVEAIRALKAAEGSSN
ncbi:hypothetical protein A3B18_03350 [Candidatus Giovannonibacteria bacterium RIFCSPLOWO2_01_FULL_46_13]|uniref:DUF5667 domain-containing protein n=1 Tax=Candidatus Giovannonibacteria bacterium RIFCSPLOWO2_01_FULL_46_13 TaxID=1798352 RepID=A0A1F5X2I5_9BACT|nr:MAG: hypothetical protein A3B18_03350 [Candidatus Giovannonibacteria bacterium RIFCSPLOWO2_01_FULL_46_13]